MQSRTRPVGREDRPDALVVERLACHEAGTLRGGPIDPVEVRQRRTDDLRGRRAVESLNRHARTLGLVHVLPVLALQVGAERLLADR